MWAAVCVLQCVCCVAVCGLQRVCFNVCVVLQCVGCSVCVALDGLQQHVMAAAFELAYVFRKGVCACVLQDVCCRVCVCCSVCVAVYVLHSVCVCSREVATPCNSGCFPISVCVSPRRGCCSMRVAVCVLQRV